MTEKKPGDQVKADGGAEDIRARADHFTNALENTEVFTALAEKDPARAAEGMTPEELAEYVALLQDVRHRLGLVERDLTTALGKRIGKTTGNLADGRQFTLGRAADRKEWDHDDWKRDVRRAIAMKFLDGVPDADGILQVVDPDSGEVEDLDLRDRLYAAMTAVQEVHGSTAPRSTSLKFLGLYASDYCTSTPAGWTFRALKPTTKEDTAHE